MKIQLLLGVGKVPAIETVNRCAYGKRDPKRLFSITSLKAIRYFDHFPYFPRIQTFVYRLTRKTILFLKGDDPSYEVIRIRKRRSHSYEVIRIR